MKLFLVVLLCFPMWAQEAATTPQQNVERAFPAQDRIQLLLTQSDRAFDVYRLAIEQEAQTGGKLAEAVPTDRAVLTAALDLLARLKKSPGGFNGPAGFLLVGYLDDATRNMSVCMGQAGMESGAQGMVGNTSGGQRDLHLVQTCLDSSTLLYTVSESAFNMYSEFLLAQDEMTKRAMSSLEKCATFLKESQKQKK
jgi:hypothetical protein